jgi:MT0933-like antitoxin protein
VPLRRRVRQVRDCSSQVGEAGDLIDDRTGNKYSEQIDKGTDQAQERTGAGDTQQ